MPSTSAFPGKTFCRKQRLRSAGIFFFSLFVFVEASATHIVGGELYYELLNANWDYEVTLKMYRDCGPNNTNNTGFDDPASVGIFDEDGDLVYNLQLYISGAMIDQIPVELENPCLALPPDLCVERVVYTSIVNLPPIPGGYTLVYQRCCRNPSIINLDIPEDTGVTFTTQIPDVELYGENSCPQFTNLPPIALCLGSEFSFDHSAIDIDGDSLVYVFCDPLQGADAFTPQPNPPNPPPFLIVNWASGYSADLPITGDPAFTIDPATGWLTGTPNLLGQFVVGVCVKEYRNGQLLSSTNRDFQFNVAYCSQGFIAEILPPAPCSGLDLQFGNNSDGAADFFWDFGVLDDENDTTSVAEPAFSFPGVGTYTVTLVINTNSDCADTTDVDIEVSPPMELEILSSGPTCSNGLWTFDFLTNGNYLPGGSFDWQFDGGTPGTFQGEFPTGVGFDTQGTYTIEVLVDDGFCVGESAVSIDVPILPLAEILPQSTFCGGLTMTFGVGNSNASSYLWNFGDASVSSEMNPTHTYGAYGTYVVTLTADPGSPCSFTDQQSVIILPPDPIESNIIVAEPNVCDTVARVNALWYGQGATSITWSFGDGEFSSDASVQHVYEETGTYLVTVTAYNELCDYTEVTEQEIGVGLGPVIAEVIVPNIFTPTGDAKNENFRMFYKDEDVVLPPYRTLFDFLDYYRMRVYNRWGNLVFDSDANGTHSWDGEYNGESDEGVYYYLLEYQRKCMDETIMSKDGYVTLLRTPRR